MCCLINILKSHLKIKALAESVNVTSSCFVLWQTVDSNGVWLTVGQQAPSHWKMHELSFADEILREKLQSRSGTISCVCMFSLSHTFTKDGRAVETEKPQLGSQFITSVCESWWFQKASQSGAARITALHPQSQKHISWWRGGRVCIASRQNHCSLYLSIFIIAQRTHPAIPWPCFGGHDSWRVHPQPHQTSNVFITATSHWHQFCLNPKRGGEKRIRLMEKERANWRVRMMAESWYPLIYTSKRWRCLANFLKLICNVFHLSVALMCPAHGSCSLPHDQWEDSVVTAHH